jgi:23S rRNA pseudouridine1911/1915/1917 synthase
MIPDESGSIPLELEVSSWAQGMRVDAFLTEELTDISRVRVSKAIDEASVLVNGKPVKRSYRLVIGDRIRGAVPSTGSVGPQPEDIPLDILYEDEHLAVINKPADMVVHPSKGHWSGTLASALRYHFDQLSSVGGETRPGIVHRLDRDTTGVIVTAKNDISHQRLAEQFEQRSVEKEYVALVNGRPDHDRDLVNEPIGPHPNQRAKMAIRKEGRQVRQAETFYELIKFYQRFSYLRLTPRTGRTHQIRVHLAHIRCPVLCDRLYSGAKEVDQGSLTGDWEATGSDAVVLSRQALHAERLALDHPDSGDRMTFTAPLPSDMKRAIECLEERQTEVRRP